MSQITDQVAVYPGYAAMEPAGSVGPWKILPFHHGNSPLEIDAVDRSAQRRLDQTQQIQVPPNCHPGCTCNRLKAVDIGIAGVDVGSVEVDDHSGEVVEVEGIVRNWLECDTLCSCC